MLTVDPEERIKLSDVLEDPWFDRFARDVCTLRLLDIHCLRLSRPSQFANRDGFACAQMLTEGMRQSGDMDIANPDLPSCVPS